MNKEFTITEYQTWAQVEFKEKETDEVKVKFIRKNLPKLQQFDADEGFLMAVKGILKSSKPDIKIHSMEAVKGHGVCVTNYFIEDGKRVEKLDENGIVLFENYEDCIDYLYQTYPDYKEKISQLE